MEISAYIRVSSDKQDVTRQRQSVQAWADRHGHTIEQWYEDSEGRNPRDQASRRAGFQRLLADVRAGLVKLVVVDSQDRFGTRDAYQLGEFLTILKDHGCQLWSTAQGHLTEDNDATVLTNTIGALTSTREQKEKAQRNVSGKVEKAKAGEYQGGYPPFGLDVVCFNEGVEQWRVHFVGHFQRVKIYPDGTRETFNGKGNFPAKNTTDVLRYRPTADKARLKIVKDVFNWFATEAVSPGQIATRLNTLGHVTTVGNPWNKVIIRQMLSNPAYVGLPAWNKRGGSRFKEWVGGEVVDVKGKLGRKRSADDYVQPTKREYAPLVDAKTWASVQAKLAGSQQGTKRAPQVSELWLRSFLVCGHCGKTMRACGPQPRMEYGSYFCGTYGTYGKDNPAGCRCHRVKHSVLEAIVERYLQETCQGLGELVGVDPSHFQQAFDQFATAQAEQNKLWLELSETAKAPTSFADIWNLNRYTPADTEHVQSLIDAKERELDLMLDDFRGLSPALKERANRKMEALQAEIVGLQAQLVDLRVNFARVSAEVEAREKALTLAVELANATGPKRAEALAKVVDKIVCHFRYVGAKSYLDFVEIIAVDQAKPSFREEIKPGQG